MRSLLPTASLAIVLIAGLVRAQVIVVTGGGAALQQAINTAPSGALLDVMPGTYSPVFATQGLHISLRPGANVSAPMVSGTVALTVSGLPSGQRFLLEGGGHIDGLSLQNCVGDVIVDGIDHVPVQQSGPASTISSCTGAVIFHRVTCTPSIGSVVYGRMDITGSTNVSFSSSRVPRLVVASANVSLSNTSNQFTYGFDPGIDIVSGRLVADGCTLWCPFTASWPLTGVGVRLQQGQFVATGATVIGQFPTFYVTPGGIETVAGTLRLDPAVQVIGGITGPIAAQIGEIPSLAVSHNATAMAVALTGEPGSALFTLAGLPMSPVPTPWGDAWLSPADVLIDVVILPASGASGFTVPVANVPPFVTLVVQSVALTTNGSLVVGAPARFVWD